MSVNSLASRWNSEVSNSTFGEIQLKKLPGHIIYMKVPITFLFFSNLLPRLCG